MDIPINVKLGKGRAKEPDFVGSQRESSAGDILTENRSLWIGCSMIVGAAVIGYAIGRKTGMKAGIKVGQKMGYATGQLETFRIISAAIR